MSHSYMLTKNDMARVIVTALYNLPKLVNIDNHHVLKLVRRKKADLERDYKLAKSTLQQRGLMQPRTERNTMTQHTPGPWHIDYDGQISTSPTKADQYSRRICSLPWTSPIEFNQEPNKSNARLIAAAPDMVIEIAKLRAEKVDLRDALEGALEDIQTCGTLFGSKKWLIEFLQAAIAKARP